MSSRSDALAELKTLQAKYNALVLEDNQCRLERTAAEKGLRDIKASSLEAEERAAKARERAKEDEAKSRGLVLDLQRQLADQKVKPVPEDQQCAVVRSTVKKYVEDHNARIK